MTARMGHGARVFTGRINKAEMRECSREKLNADRNRHFTTEKGSAMKIKLTSVFVDDHDKALKFYTDVLGFAKKTDFTHGTYRWLTVVSPEEPDGTQLQLALNDNLAAKTYQRAILEQKTPAANFFVADTQSEYARLKGLGVTFTMEPTKTAGSTIAVLDDTCGNLIQITHLEW
jgi:predicted enzyme related to lactoylglutathione lyase